MTVVMERTTANNAKPRLLAGKYRVTTIGLVTVVTLLAFDEMSVGTVMPVTARDLGGLSLYAWGFSATLIASLFANVVAGAWIDARGPARPMLTGLVVFVAGLLLAGLAPTMAWFVVGRAIQGFGAGTTIVANYVVIARVYPEELRPRVFSAMAAAWVVPSLIGPAVAGAVAEHLHWRLVFLGLIVFVVPAALGLLPVLRQGGAGTGEFARAKALAGAGVAGGAALLLYGLAHNVIFILLGLGGLVYGLPKLLPPGTLRLRRGLPSAVLLRLTFAAGFFGTEAFVPLALTRLHGFTPTEAGIVLTAAALGWTSASQIQGRSTRPRSFFILLGAVLVAVGTAAVAFTLTASGMVAGLVIWPAWIVAGSGMGLGLASISVLVLNQSDPDQQGVNSSALQIGDTLGSSLTIGVAGALVTGLSPLSTGLRAAGVLTALIAVAGIVAALRVENPQ